VRPLLLSTLLFAAAACAAPSAEEPAPTPGGGGGGSGGAPASCVDLSGAGDCRYDGPGGGCVEDQVCSVAPGRSCGELACCTLPLACTMPAGGFRPGGFSCSEDDDCAGDLCVTVGGVGLCARACSIAGGAGCPGGFACSVVSLDGARSVHACVGVDEGGAFEPEKSLCHHDRDCADGRYCQVQLGTRFYDGIAFGLCVPGARAQPGLSTACEAAGPLSIGEAPPGVSEPSLGYRATLWSEACGESGLCHNACIDLDPEACNCRQPQDQAFCRGARCLPPCGVDTDCPSPFICGLVKRDEVSRLDPLLPVRVCTFPAFDSTNWGCFDETDCCRDGVQRHGGHCCNTNAGTGCLTPPPDRTHCRVEPGEGRYLARCALPSGLQPPGGPCTAHADCESALCAPSGVCTSPCDPGAGDRCGEILEGTQCCPLPVGDACIPACRSDCADGPGCTP